MPVQTSSRVSALKNIATRLRIDSVRATSEAGTGHPSTCCSAAEIVAALFFAEMRYDPADPRNEDNDRFVLSKGHAAPILYAAWAEAGIIPREHLLTLRRLDSDLEGHPTPRLPWVDVATGSLGQGLCAGVGIALNARRITSDYRTYVLMGDGETAEGSVWEVGGGGGRGFARFTLRHRRRQRSRSEPRDAARSRHGGARRAVARLRLERDRHRRSRPAGDSRCARSGAGDEGSSDGDPGAHGQGPGHLDHGRQAGLARQGAQEGRRAGRGAERTRGAVRARGGAACRRRTPPRQVSRPVPTRGALGTLPYKLGESVATREAYGAALARLGAGDESHRRRSMPTWGIPRSARSSRSSSRIASTSTTSPSRR